MIGTIRKIKQVFSTLRQLSNPELSEWLYHKAEELSGRRGILAANPGTFIHPDVRVIGAWQSIRLGRGVRIAAGTVLTADHAASEIAFDVGENTYIGEYCNLRVAAGSRLTVGSNSLIAQFVTLVTANHLVRSDQPQCIHSVDNSKLGVVIGNWVWIGAGCVVTAGVRIGDGAVIGANSVVTRDVPRGEVWAGSPARPLHLRQSR